MKTIKYLTTIFIFLISYNALATHHLPFCNSDHTIEKYNQLYQSFLEENISIDDIYHLGVTSLCLENTHKGLIYLQKAADANHIIANFLLGTYYRNNRSFNPANLKHNADLENWDKTIAYYTTATQIIASFPNYPEGINDEIISTESSNHLSYWLFTQLPAVHLDKYLIIIHLMAKNDKERATGTLDILTKMVESAAHCLNRPGLDIWKENKENMYKRQKIICDNLQTAAKRIYPLEQQRIKIAQSCTKPLNKCSKYNKHLNIIMQLIHYFYSQMLQPPTDSQSEI